MYMYVSILAQNTQLAKCKIMVTYALQKDLAMELWADQ